MTNLTNGHKFSHEELLKALYNVEDFMDQLVTPYFLLMETGDCVKHDRLLSGTGIDVGMRNKSFTQFVYDIMKTNFNLTPEEINQGFEYKVGEVPVRVKVYTRNYKFFQYPDIKIYEYGRFQLPNPWDVYWQTRFIVR